VIFADFARFNFAGIASRLESRAASSGTMDLGRTGSRAMPSLACSPLVIVGNLRDGCRLVAGLPGSTASGAI
jgi:hypothetical protein